MGEQAIFSAHWYDKHLQYYSAVEMKLFAFVLRGYIQENAGAFE